MDKLVRIPELLLPWYHLNLREMPWRENHDPYRIWISEVMLQQTQVATVIEYFNRFMQAFPTVFDLAKATEDEVFKLWEGLGYYSRARNLMRCAKILVDQYQGIFPQELKKALLLPGIGPYTAGAVLSIAYNEPVPAVDGNVMRVISRLYGRTEDIGDPKTRLGIESLVIQMLPSDRRHFNQALMELGATVCTPKNPKCERCPIASCCTALETNQTAVIPVKLQKLKKTTHIVPAAYVTFEDQVLIIKREGSGLLSGLWAFPVVELEASPAPMPLEDTAQVSFIAQENTEAEVLRRWLEEHMDLSVSEESEFLGQVKHVFTHKTWHLHLWHFKALAPVHTEMPLSAWVSRGALSQYALPTAFVKLIKNSKTP